MKVKTPHDIFRSILSHLAMGPIKVDASKACYILNDYFEKGITLKDIIKVPPSTTKYFIEN